MWSRTHPWKSGLPRFVLVKLSMIWRTWNVAKVCVLFNNSRSFPKIAIIFVKSIEFWMKFRIISQQSSFIPWKTIHYEVLSGFQATARYYACGLFISLTSAIEISRSQFHIHPDWSLGVDAWSGIANWKLPFYHAWLFIHWYCFILVGVM